MIDKLNEATERYAQTDPMAVRHIEAALGRNAARKHKRITVKRGKRVIVVDQADHGTAVNHLSKATSLLPKEYGNQSAFDALTESRLIKQLAESHMAIDNRDEAISTLDKAIQQMKKRKSAEPLIDDLEDSLKAIKQRKR